jgi:hypothetical protein
MEPDGARPKSTELVVVPRESRPLLALDVGIDVAAALARGGVTVVRTGVRVARPFAGLVLRPARSSPAFVPSTRLAAMAGRGRAIRDRGEQQANAALSYVMPIVVNAVLDKIDLTAVVSRLDLNSIAREVIEGIDLPEIIRESSGAMASETVVGVRMRGIEADERISRLVDRVILRRRGRDALVADREAGPDGGD